MRVRVLFFGMLKDLAGRSEDSLELSESSRLDDLLAHYQRSAEALAATVLGLNCALVAPAIGWFMNGDASALLRLWSRMLVGSKR